MFTAGFGLAQTITMLIISATHQILVRHSNFSNSVQVNLKKGATIHHALKGMAKLLMKFHLFSIDVLRTGCNICIARYICSDHGYLV